MWADADNDTAFGFADRLDEILSRHWPELRGRVVSAKPGRTVLPMEAGPRALQNAIEAFGQRYPGGDRRAVASLFTQWYLATSWPALVTGLLLTGRAPPADASAIRLESCGTPGGLVIRGEGRVVDMPTGLERLVQAHAAPLMEAAARYGAVSPRVPWSNAINVLGWTLEHLPGVADAASLDDARGFFIRRYLSDGSPNPLWVRQPPNWQRGGRPSRRTCCLRYSLSGVDYCGDCPVPTPRRTQ